MRRTSADISTDLLLPIIYCGLVTVLSAWLLVTHYSGWMTHPKFCFGDCILYQSIAEKGYYYIEGGRSNTNFFPLFPLLWRWSGFGEAGISFVNMLCFISGCFLLFRNFPASLCVKVLTLGLGCIVFYLVPFTEGIFYLTATLMLIGLQQRKAGLVIVALTIMCLLRSVSMLFFPVWMALALLRYADTESLKKVRIYAGYAIWGALLVILLFLYFHYKTGEFWAFVKAQRVWGAAFRLPQIPFGAWGDDRHMIFAQYSVFFCLISSCYLVWLFVQRIRKRDFHLPDDATLFSLLYIAANGVFPLVMRGGEYSSLNRYILSTPFLYFFFKEINTFRFNRGSILFLIIIELLFLFVCWQMYASATRLIIATVFMCAMAIIPWLLQSRSTLSFAALVIATAIGIYLQSVQFVDFVHGIWVG